jgi:hypothetical protein
MKRYSSNKDWNALIKSLVRQGWRYTRRRKHGRLIAPAGGRFITVPCSPSDYRGLRNFRRQVAWIDKANGRRPSRYAGDE